MKKTLFTLAVLLSSALASFAQPAASSEVINNSFTYNNTPENRNAPESSQEIVLNAQFTVGEEIVAEGVQRIISNETDKQQGITVRLKKRGVTT